MERSAGPHSYLQCSPPPPLSHGLPNLASEIRCGDTEGGDALPIACADDIGLSLSTCKVGSGFDGGNAGPARRECPSRHPNLHPRKKRLEKS